MGRYTPGSLADPQVADEFKKVAGALDSPNVMLALDALYAAPKKFREGSIVLAKSPWNPGSGDGVYCYRGGAWRFLG